MSRLTWSSIDHQRTWLISGRRTLGLQAWSAWLSFCNFEELSSFLIRVSRRWTSSFGTSLGIWCTQVNVTFIEAWELSRISHQWLALVDRGLQTPWFQLNSRCFEHRSLCTCWKIGTRCPQIGSRSHQLPAAGCSLVWRTHLLWKSLYFLFPDMEWCACQYRAFGGNATGRNLPAKEHFASDGCLFPPFLCPRWPKTFLRCSQSLALCGKLELLTTEEGGFLFAENCLCFARCP